MSATTHLNSGNLQESYKALTAEIRANASDVKRRIFLFQLLCIRGEWQRAVTQLKVIGEMDATALPMVQTYREVLVCEKYRESVFAGRKAPLVFGEPQEWVALLIESLKLLAMGNSEAAASLRAQAFDMAPATAGQADGNSFCWIADADMRLGPVLEIIMNGQYYWVPFAAVSQLKFEEPGDLRDQVWSPVEITFANGGQSVGFIPSRYPGTAETGDDALMLARKTDWQDAGNETFVGVGQRLFATDTDDMPLLDLRSLILQNEATDGAG